MRRKAIDRVHGISPESFATKYLSGFGLPVIVTDAMENWAALATWDFRFFRDRFGSETVIASGGMKNRSARIMKLADYVDYCEAPEAGAKGFWIDPSTKMPIQEPLEQPVAPLYVYSWNPLATHPELLSDVTPTPYFAEDWITFLPKELQPILHFALTPNYWVLLGPAGTVSSLHQDGGAVHAYLAQLRGRKQCTLFSPEDSASVYQGMFDPGRPDFERFPNAEHATAYEAVIEPGDMLFMPARWWHHVVALEPSITFSYGFFNRTNFGDHVVEALRRLPDWLAALDRAPGLRKALGIRWTSRGFDYIEKASDS